MRGIYVVDAAFDLASREMNIQPVPPHLHPVESSVKNGWRLSYVDVKWSLLDVSAAAALMMTNAEINTIAPFAIGPVTDVTHFVLEHDAPEQVVSALRGGAEVWTSRAPNS